MNSYPHETYTERNARHLAFFQALAAHLTDLGAEIISSGRGLKVGDITMSFDTGAYGRELLSLDTGAWSWRRGGNRRRYTTLDPRHIARQVRRLRAEQAAETAARQKQRARLEAETAREEAVKAPLQGEVDALNAKAQAVRYVRLVTALSVQELPDATTGPRYSVSMELDGLDPEVAAEVLQVVAAARPWDLAQGPRLELQAPSLAELEQAFDVPSETTDDDQEGGAR